MILDNKPAFVSHGSPMMAVQVTEASTHLDKWFATRSKPKGIVVVSAHWQTRSHHAAITTHETPQTVHDFGGFPDALYRICYPAKTDSELIKRVMILLSQAGMSVEESPNRGFDHGVWVPLIRMCPQADIPVVQLALPQLATSVDYYKMGQALQSLAAEQILVLGSGALSHNLGALGSADTPVPEWVTGFREWVNRIIESGDINSLLEWDKLAPYALQNHPTPEHFLPLFFAVGAGSIHHAKRVHQSIELGSLAMDCWEF